MKKIFPLLFAIIFTSTLFSQDKELNLDGKFALQFQIGSLISLRDFQGATFSGKYYFTNCLALRFGVGASINNSDGDGYEGEEPEGFKLYHFTRETSERTIIVRAQIINYFSLFNDFSFYAGGGPFISDSKRDHKQIFADTSRVDNIDRIEASEYGVDIVGGAEWFVNENISISGEYGFGISVGTEKQHYEYSYRKSNSESDIFRIRPSQVRFGLSVYF